MFVGNAAPQEERQARGQFEIAKAVGLLRRYVRRAVDPQQEVRVDEQAFERELNAAVKVAAVATAALEEPFALIGLFAVVHPTGLARP